VGVATRFQKGLIPWNKTEGVHINCGHCGVDVRLEPNQVGRKKFCSKACFYKGRQLKGLFQKGHPDLVPQESRGHSEETKQKLAEHLRKNARRGPDNPNWRGGARTERKIAMGRFEYQDWRKAVFGRDNYTCQECNASGVYLEADHIKPWCAYPELRYDVGNGRTLCRPCHMKQDTHGRGALKYLEAA
jgi:5-methylcytosine-specific restriction endonuclease McrA